MQIIIQNQTAGGQKKWGATMNHRYVFAILINLLMRKEWNILCRLFSTSLYIYFSGVFIYTPCNTYTYFNLFLLSKSQITPN